MKREYIAGIYTIPDTQFALTKGPGLQFPGCFVMILITVQGDPWAVNSTTVSGSVRGVAKGGREKRCLRGQNLQTPRKAGLAEAVGDEG